MEDLRFGHGYDHCWVLSKEAGIMGPVAELYDPGSGRLLTISSTEPGLQFYSGNFLNGDQVGKGGIPYHFRTGLCLECQNFPDAPNQPDFPSSVLLPGKVYRKSTIYKFSIK